MKKAILFDMGDTLVYNLNMDFNKGIKYIYTKTLKCNKDQNSFEVESFKILNDIFGARTVLEFKMIEYIKLLIELFELKFDESIEDIEEGFAYSICDIEFVLDAKKILEYFKNKNYKLILMSNTSFSRRVVLKMLGDLSDYFDEIIISSETVFRKPSQHFFEIGIRKLSLEKENIYYIGNDYYYDVYGSSNSGINSIWFNENNNSKKEKYIVESYKEIQKYSQLIEEDF